MVMGRHWGHSDPIGQKDLQQIRGQGVRGCQRQASPPEDDVSARGHGRGPMHFMG